LRSTKVVSTVNFEITANDSYQTHQNYGDDSIKLKERAKQREMHNLKIPDFLASQAP
jgi:hypothetical protein